MTARQRLAVFANVSRIQSDQETYDMAVNRDVELKRQRVRAERAEAERDAARALLQGIVSAYANYRRKGVAPAPTEYADVVTAITRAAAALAKGET